MPGDRLLYHYYFFGRPDIREIFVVIGPEFFDAVWIFFPVNLRKNLHFLNIFFEKEKKRKEKKRKEKKRKQSLAHG